MSPFVPFNEASEFAAQTEKFDTFAIGDYLAVNISNVILSSVRQTSKRLGNMYVVYYNGDRMRSIVQYLLPLVLVIFASQPVNAQQANAQQASTSKSADTSSPRATLRSFIDSCNELYGLIVSEHYLDASNPDHARNIAQIVDCVDVSGVPAFARNHRATEIAICIKEILDREKFPEWESIPDEAAVDADSESEKTQSWRFPGTRITITKIDDGPRKHEYLFSEGTASRAVSSYHNISSDPYRTTGPAVSKRFYDWYVSVPGKRSVGIVVQQFPEWLQKGTTFSMAKWKWIGILLTLFVSFSVMWAAYRLQWKFAPEYRQTRVGAYCLTMLFPVIAMLIPPVAQVFLEDYLTIRGNPLYTLSFAADTRRIA
jgi:MscS family membrane protein